MKTENPMIHGAMNSRTRVERRATRRRDCRRRVAPFAPRAMAVAIPSPSPSTQLRQLVVDLLGHAFQACLEIAHLTALPLLQEGAEEVLVGGADRRVPLVVGPGVLEDVEERLELLGDLEVWSLQ